MALDHAIEPSARASDAGAQAYRAEAHGARDKFQSESIEHRVRASTGSSRNGDRALASEAGDTHYSGSEIYSSAHPSSPKRSDWTVAVDLTADLRDDKTGKIVAGAQSKWQQLKDLAKDTEGKPVTLVVSVARETGDPTKPAGPEGARQGAQQAPRDGGPPAQPSRDGTGTAPRDATQPAQDGTQSPQDGTQPPRDGTQSPQDGAQPPRDGAQQSPGDAQPARSANVDTYVIRDGKIQKIDSRASEGMAADAQRLLETAQRVAPSDHLGLVMQGHGTDTEGMHGNSGFTTVSELHDAIQKGLASGGRTRLDVLDFDACLMGSKETARRMSDVASHMVASSDEELADGARHRFDGQNLGAVVKDLLRQPHQSGRELAEDFVRSADKGANGTPVRTEDDKKHLRAGTDTLASYDLSKYPQFEQSLNKFGDALQRAMEDPNNKKAIQAAIDHTGTLPGPAEGFVTPTRDTKQFAERILESIKSGELRDADGSVKQGAQALLDAQKGLVTAYHGSGHYKDMGGLSAQLPATSDESRTARASRQTPAGWLRDMDADSSITRRGRDAQKAKELISDLRSTLPQDSDEQLKALVAAQKHMQDSRTQPEYTRAVSELRSSAAQFLQTPAGKDLVARTQAAMKARVSDGSGGSWAQFIDRVQS